MYNSLDTLPIVLYFRIVETGNIALLNPNGVEVQSEELQIIWDNLHLEFQDVDQNYLNNKILMLSKQYDYYILTYEVVNRCVEALRFSYNEDLISIVKKKGFRITKSNYLEDLDRTQIDSEGLLEKAKHFKSQLPKPEVTENNEKVSIEDILSSYSMVLGFHLGSYMNITCREFISLKKQVNIKMRQQEKQLRDLKNRKKNGL
ncbi:MULTISPECIES: hypothetical protein [unclassified Myroides]|uniref:hypothetical protein n=1 Tax=unclassified Myroides TaxID=2642485 RepID=UPI003D2F6E31